jgi:hypothetical protein
VEHYRASLTDADRAFIFSDQYDMTSALAFYTPGQPRTYCAWVDRRMNQYDLWPAPGAERIGCDAVLVLKGQDNPTPDQPIIAMFTSISDPIHVNTTYHDAPARTFTIFLCKGYKGNWTRLDQGHY